MHALITRTCKCLMLHNNRELMWQMKLRLLICCPGGGAVTLDYLGGSNVIVRILKNGGERQRARVREDVTTSWSKVREI